MLRSDEAMTAYRIPSLAVPDLGIVAGTTCQNITPQDLWDHPAVLVEMDLIVAITRELGLNSAFGGPDFIAWSSSPEVRDMTNKVDHSLLSGSGQDPVAPTLDPVLRKDIEEHYRCV